jgi:hypothetical protein
VLEGYVETLGDESGFSKWSIGESGRYGTSIDSQLVEYWRYGTSIDPYMGDPLEIHIWFLFAAPLFFSGGG